MTMDLALTEDSSSSTTATINEINEKLEIENVREFSSK